MQCAFVKLSLTFALAAATAREPTARDDAEPTVQTTAFEEGFAGPRRNRGVGRPEADWLYCCAMTVLGNGLSAADQNEDALSVKMAELAMERRLGASENDLLVTQGNISNTYSKLGRLEEALSLRREVHSGRLKIHGEEDKDTLGAAVNFAGSLMDLQRFEEAKSLMRKTMPIARRVLGNCHEHTLKTQWQYAKALYLDDSAPLDDLREAVETYEDTERTAWRVLGASHPMTVQIGLELEDSRAALRARESWWPFIVCALSIVVLAWVYWALGLGAMVFTTFAIMVFDRWQSPT